MWDPKASEGLAWQAKVGGGNTQVGFSSTITFRCWNFPGQEIIDFGIFLDKNISIFFGQDLASILIVALQLQHGPAQRGGEAETADRPDFRPGGFSFPYLLPDLVFVQVLP